MRAPGRPCQASITWGVSLLGRRPMTRTPFTMPVEQMLAQLQ
jgi:hypothetical protein